MRQLSGLLLLVAMVTPCAADEGIDTDRPNFSNSSEIVGKSVLQIETGFNRQSEQDANGAHTWTSQTPVLLRAGLTNSFEARVETDGYTWIHSDGSKSEGMSDLSVGFKWRHHSGEGVVPSVGSILMAALPSGAREIGENGVRPEYQLPLDWAPTKEWQFTLMPGAACHHSPTGDRFFAGELGISADYEWRPGFQTFIEWADEQLAPARYGGVIASVNTGLAYRLNPNWQVDGALEWGANHNSSNFLWTLGLSART